MNIFKKLKNHKGSAESALFVLGIAIFATVVIFALDIFGLTWQRYLSTRELSNISRLYAIRAYDLYYETDQYGTYATIVTNPEDSDLGEEIVRALKILVEHGNVTKARIRISDKGNLTLLTLEVTENDVDFLEYVSMDRLKTIDYGETLYAELIVEYEHSALTGIAKQQEAHSRYGISNKFAFEAKKRTESGID